MHKSKIQFKQRQENYSFIGDWQGDGTDSKGNVFNFFARVTHLGDNRYRMLILTDLEKVNEPIHIMDGVLENNKFSYTADEGVYKGGGILSKDRFEGYYKGPVDDIEESAKKVESLGGKVILPPTDMPEVGRFCVINDPQGISLNLIEYTTKDTK